jgi:hypothetical protein
MLFNPYAGRESSVSDFRLRPRLGDSHYGKRSLIKCEDACAYRETSDREVRKIAISVIDRVRSYKSFGPGPSHETVKHVDIGHLFEARKPK